MRAFPLLFITALLIISAAKVSPSSLESNAIAKGSTSALNPILHSKRLKNRKSYRLKLLRKLKKYRKLLRSRRFKKLLRKSSRRRSLFRRKYGRKFGFRGSRAKSIRRHLRYRRLYGRKFKKRIIRGNSLYRRKYGSPYGPPFKNLFGSRRNNIYGKRVIRGRSLTRRHSYFRSIHGNPILPIYGTPTDCQSVRGQTCSARCPSGAKVLPRYKFSCPTGHRCCAASACPERCDAKCDSASSQTLPQYYCASGLSCCRPKSCESVSGQRCFDPACPAQATEKSAFRCPNDATSKCCQLPKCSSVSGQMCLSSSCPGNLEPLPNFNCKGSMQCCPSPSSSPTPSASISISTSSSPSSSTTPTASVSASASATVSPSASTTPSPSASMTGTPSATMTTTPSTSASPSVTMAVACGHLVEDSSEYCVFGGCNSNVFEPVFNKSCPIGESCCRRKPLCNTDSMSSCYGVECPTNTERNPEFRCANGNRVCCKSALCSSLTGFYCQESCGYGTTRAANAWCPDQQACCTAPTPTPTSSSSSSMKPSMSTAPTPSTELPVCTSMTGQSCSASCTDGSTEVSGFACTGGICCKTESTPNPECPSDGGHACMVLCESGYVDAAKYVCSYGKCCKYTFSTNLSPAPSASSLPPPMVVPTPTASASSTSSPNSTPTPSETLSPSPSTTPTPTLPLPLCNSVSGQTCGTSCTEESSAVAGFACSSGICCKTDEVEKPLCPSDRGHECMSSCESGYTEAPIYSCSEGMCCKYLPTVALTTDAATNVTSEATENNATVPDSMMADGGNSTSEEQCLDFDGMQCLASCGSSQEEVTDLPCAEKGKKCCEDTGPPKCEGIYYKCVAEGGCKGKLPTGYIGCSGSTPQCCEVEPCVAEDDGVCKPQCGSEEETEYDCDVLGGKCCWPKESAESYSSE